LKGNLMDRIRAWGFHVHELPVGPFERADVDPSLPVHAPWLEASWREDAEAVSRILSTISSEPEAPGLIVDHYGLDAAWESRLRPMAGWIAAIDDLADRPHECDLLLDQNLFEDQERRYVGLVPPECRMLLGPRFSLLRGEFSGQKAALRRAFAGVRCVLVYFGGVDADDNTSKALQALSLAEWEGKRIEVVISGGHRRRREIEAHCSRHAAMTVHVDTDRMSALMAEADLALGAGGSSTWERCCLGLPCVAVCIADNQAGLMRVLDARGALIDLGRSEAVTARSLADSMLALAERPEGLLNMSQTASALVDGQGAERVAGALSGLPEAAVPGGRRGAAPEIRLRPARPGDAAIYFEWLNDGEARRNSFRTGRVGWQGHFAWFRSKLADSASRLFVLECRGRPAGQIRFDPGEAGFEIDFSVAPADRGRGLGSELLRRGTEALLAGAGGPVTFIGRVKEGNAASAKAFLRAGFESVDLKPKEGEPCLVFRKAISARS
jgi:UDP-2,4-diacetamido-2,4,6-trideoxy-beta-L-altropyranose hydrolase